MIAEGEAKRLDGWIQEAVARRRDAAVRRQARGRDARGDAAGGCRPQQPSSIARRRSGPVAILSSSRDFDAALDEVNDSKFGLQAGIFTRDLFKMLDAWDRLDVGGVVINDVPSLPRRQHALWRGQG